MKKFPKPDHVTQERIEAMMDIVRSVRFTARQMREWGLRSDAARAYQRARGYLDYARRLRDESNDFA